MTRPQRTDASYMAEALEDESARRSLINFTKRTMPKYQAGWFSEELASKLDQFLEDCVAGKNPRLMVMAPPRHGKSELISIRFPAYALGKYPDLQIMLTSHAAPLAERMSRFCQRVMRSETYQRIFKSRIPERSKQNAEGKKGTDQIFELLGSDGSLRTSGAEGDITGHGADILIIDDPVKGSKTARSKTIQNSTWEWYRETAYPRVENAGGVLIVQTRWHEEDLSGKLLDAMERGMGDEWEIVRYPAIAEEDEPNRKKGEALHEERKPLKLLKMIEKTLGERSFGGLYQQRPTHQEGDIFTPERIEIVEELPAPIARQCRAWDKAATKGDGDWTVGVLLAELEPNPVAKYAVLDVVRGQWASDRREAVILQTAKLDGYDVPIHLEQEPGSGGKDSVLATTKMLAGWSVRGKPASGDKVLRADPASAQVNAGQFCALRRRWNGEFLEELRGFDTSKHDDQVDALAMAFNAMSQTPVSWEDIDEWTGVNDEDDDEDDWAA